MNLQQNRIRIREQLKVFRRIVYVILVLVIIMFSFMLFGHMDDEVIGNGTVTGIRDYDLKALVSARTVRSFTFRHLPKPVRQALGKSVWNTASSDRAISAHSLSDGSRYRSMCSAPSEDKMLYSIAWT